MAIPNTTYRILVEKLGDADPDEFVGNEGEVFYDPNSPELKLSDGETVGGISIGGSGSGGLTANDVGEDSYELQLSDEDKLIDGSAIERVVSNSQNITWTNYAPY